MASIIQKFAELKITLSKFGSFREQFEKMKPGPEREELIYQYAIKQPLPKLVPVEAKGPNGVTVIYNVLPDYFMIDGIRVPMSALTAQRVANHFGMELPTAKMSKQIWNAGDVKLKPQPMSGGATINGKYYTGQQVVNNMIGNSETSIAFNDKINKSIQNSNKGNLFVGQMKDIVMPDTGKGDTRTHAVGWYNKDGTPIQGGNGQTKHDLNHSEYASGARLVQDSFTFKTKDGKTIGPLTMEELIKNPEYSDLAKSISSNPKALSKYNVKNQQKQTVDKKVDMATNIGKSFESEQKTSAGPLGLPGKPPNGYSALKADEITSEISSIAKGLLSGDYGTQTPFTIDGNNYMARVEPHRHATPPPGSSEEEKKKYPKPWGWHKGVTVYGDLNRDSSGTAPKSIKKSKDIEESDELYQKIMELMGTINIS